MKLTDLGGKLVGHPEGTEIVPSDIIFKAFKPLKDERQFTIPSEGLDPDTLKATVFLRKEHYERTI